jgi:sugar phosphate isomerase/epimerase
MTGRPQLAAFPKCYLEQIARERTMSVFEWIDEARGLPVAGLELYEGFLVRTDDEGYLDSVAEAVASAGFVMPMLCCSPDLTNPDPDERRRAVAHEAHMIAITRRLGGGFCRVLTGQRHPGVSDDEGIEWVVEAVNELLPVADEHAVCLALENHYKDGHWLHAEFAQRSETFLRVLDAIGERRWFGVQFDPSNAVVAGDDPVALLDAVIDRVVTMHASDRHLEPGHDLASLRTADRTIGYSPHLRHGVIGQGVNDYPAMLERLAAAGYDGWISIEDGLNGIDEIRASAKFLDEAIARAYAAASDGRG